MPLKMRDAGNTLRTIKAFKMRDAGNVLRTIATIKMRGANNVLWTVYSGVSLVVTPSTSTPTKTLSSPYGASRTVTTPAVMFTVTGGSGSYTYSTVKTSGDTIVTAGTPSASSTTFSAFLASDTQAEAFFTCTATDTVTGLTATTIVDATLFLVGP